MSYWLGVMISLGLPFVLFGMWWMCFAWWLQRVPPNRKAIARAEALGPLPPPIRMTDEHGNARREWASDLMQQRLRNIDTERR